MKFIVTKNHEELSSVMCQLLLAQMHSSIKRKNIAITTGSTCVKGYQYLAPLVKDKPYFQNIHYYIFDEFWFHDEAGEKDTSVCQVSLDTKYFHDANIQKDHIHDLDYQNYQSFDQDIQKDGGLDLVIMGIGENGHFCGNQPGTFDAWSEGTRRVKTNATPYLIAYSKKLLRQDFHSENEARIPDYYLTMGSKTIMNARQIIFILSGKQKAEVAKKAFFSPISRDFPVSIFQLHHKVTVILDEDAASLIKEFLPHS